MGGVLKTLGKVASFVKPFVTMINPLAGMALGFAADLAQGKNPLKAALSAATDLIPGGGVLKNVLGKFAGPALMDGMGGNALLSGALDLVTGKSKVTDVVGDLVKSQATKGLSQLGLNNAAELAAKRMSQMVAA